MATQHPQFMNTSEAKRVLETALICAAAPLPLADMKSLFDGEVGSDTLRVLLDELSRDWADRGVELVALAGGWRFQSRPEMRPWLDRLHPEKPPKYSRAALETLAIVAYKQPISRAQVSAIRGVDVDGVMRTLQQRGYIDEIDRDAGPGQAILFGTTELFLEKLGLDTLDDLPTLGDFVPDAKVVEALEAGLRPDPLPEVADAAVVAGASTGAAEGEPVTDVTDAVVDRPSAEPSRPNEPPPADPGVVPGDGA